MISELQQKAIDKKILQVVKDFYVNGGSIEDVSKRTGISSSSVQRYLNHKNIVTLLGQEVYDNVQEKLLLNKQNGLSKGGTNSTHKYIGVRDDKGQFIGNIKR